MKLIKSTLAVAVTTALLATSLPANALTSFLSLANSYTSIQAGAVNIDFGTSAATNAGPVVSGPGVVFSGAGFGYTDGALYNLVTSPISGTTARPVGSVDNFYSVGPTPPAQTGPGVVTFSSGLSYFGFLWGSPDDYNTVTFYNGGTVLGSFTGSVVSNPASGNQAYSRYFNVFAGQGEVITRVSFASSQNAFETDNHAFITAVPEPGTYAMLLAGLGVMATIARRRKQNPV